jgi:endoglucanase
MGVDESGGYLQDKTANKNRIKTIIDAAIEHDLYVIIDWHSHHAEDYQADAVEFFTEMATLYGGYDHVLYEIYNEPLSISWSNKIKPYAEAVISAIRAKDPDNMIIVGTPEWSQRVDQAAADPIMTSTNIAYTLHFYTVHHQQWLRDRATAALEAGLPIFVTEWGSVGYTNTDPETDKWMEWCKSKKISHCNWAVNDKVEEWSILVQGSSTSGGWHDSSLTPAGQLSRKIIRGW